MNSVDPVAVLLSDPESHYSDPLYLYFRLYKKRLLKTLFFKVLPFLTDDSLHICDVGASAGYDLLYLMSVWTQNFRKAIPAKEAHLTLAEGDPDLVAQGRQLLDISLRSEQVTFEYLEQSLTEALGLQTSSQHLVLCSEVVEHLEYPDRLLREIYRILVPGGFLIFTTDNSPSLLQQGMRALRRLAFRKKNYQRPEKSSAVAAFGIDGNRERYPIYGHINLRPAREWERMARDSGFSLYSFGTYESIRRGGAGSEPVVLAIYFLAGALVSLLPRSIGRNFGDTTAMLLRKPS